MTSTVTETVTAPSPLTPPDCDLRDFSWMPLDVLRLRDSDLTVLASGDAFRAAVLLWCASWHQVPAASLPTDDRLLANLAGYGRDMKGWAEVRDDALRGFVTCTDGRLYHPVVAEKALEADVQRRAQKERTKKATDARRNVKRDDTRNVDRNEEKARNDTGNGVRDVDRDDTRNEVQQTGPDKTGEERTRPKRTKLKPVAVVVPREPEKSAGTTTTTQVENDLALQVEPAKPPVNPLGTALPETWIPDEGCLTVAFEHGMSEADVEGEVLRFHAVNAQRGTFSQNWNKTWTLWCAEFKRRKAVVDAKPKPRVEVTKADPSYEPTERDWHSAAKIYAQIGRWNISFGPEPTSPACKCPPDILAKYIVNHAAVPVLAARAPVSV